MGVQFPILVDRLHTKTNCPWIILGNWKPPSLLSTLVLHAFFPLTWNDLVETKQKPLSWNMSRYPQLPIKTHQTGNATVSKMDATCNAFRVLRFQLRKGERCGG